MSEPRLHRRFACCNLLAMLMIGGCAARQGSLGAEPVNPAGSAASKADLALTVPVTRYGRYTLVELAPSAAQRDLLQQIIDVSLPQAAQATVGDGLRHALARSGYSLCDASDPADTLYPLPLPAAHQQLGPMSLREALLVLAGPAWELHTDPLTRRVCFERAQQQPEDAMPGAPLQAVSFPIPAPQEGQP